MSNESRCKERGYKFGCHLPIWQMNIRLQSIAEQKNENQMYQIILVRMVISRTGVEYLNSKMTIF